MFGTRSLRLAGLAISTILATAACSGGWAPTPDSSSARAAAAAKLPKVVSVSPATLTGTTPIVVTFRRPLPSGVPLPSLAPAVPGRWTAAGSAATFTPSVAYPPSTGFTVTVPQKSGTPKTVGQPASAAGSLRFAEQILARLHYLPLDTKAAQPSDATAEAAALYTPPVGKFTWRFGNVPATLKKNWVPGKPNTVLRGAVIAFQHDANLTQDGAIGPATWKALQQADLDGATDPDKYSYVFADLYPRPQELSVWIDGKTVLTTPVNGGVPAAPTPLGTYPVYLRYAATTMQGTNPDGTKYKDKGVPWVNYFSGGSAVHGFVRASYGYPQSVGCLELPPDTAKKVYDLIGYGTLVTVTGPYIKPPKVAEPSPPATASPTPTSSKHPKSTASPTAATSPSPTPTRSHKPKG